MHDRGRKCPWLRGWSTRKTTTTRRGAVIHEERSDLNRDSSKPLHAALLKNDFIRKVNGIKIESNSTISQFVQKIKLARKSNATDASGLTHVLLEIERPMPPKSSAVYKSLNSQHFTVVATPLQKESSQYSSLGNCVCSRLVPAACSIIASCRHCPCLQVPTLTRNTQTSSTSMPRFRRRSASRLVASMTTVVLARLLVVRRLIRRLHPVPPREKRLRAWETATVSPFSVFPAAAGGA